jgi:hypothetical protein
MDNKSINWQAISVIIAAGAFIISMISIWRTIIFNKRLQLYQEYEYSSRLQLGDEKVIFGDINRDDFGIKYSAILENRGMKTVDIDNIYMDYGDGINKQFKQSIEGNFYLRPEQKREINVTVPRKGIDDMKRRYDTDDVMFSFRVVINEPGGKKVERLRKVGGFNGRHLVIIVQKGNVL